MKKIILVFAIIFPCCLFAQLGIGLKAGLNFANVSNASDINSSSRSGFMVGAFLAPHSKGILASRTELIYSKQGYNFKTATQTGNVNLYYIIIPQLMGINITKFVQIQVGMQTAFLINAKADTTSNNSSIPGNYGSILSYYNKFDYAVAVGAEIHPVLGLLIGARYNIGLGKLYSGIQTGQAPSFSAADAKNNVIQVFAGWIFGGKDKSKKQK